MIKLKKYAAIDIGSNAMRLLVANIIEEEGKERKQLWSPVMVYLLCDLILCQLFLVSHYLFPSLILPLLRLLTSLLPY